MGLRASKTQSTSRKTYSGSTEFAKTRILRRALFLWTALPTFLVTVKPILEADIDLNCGLIAAICNEKNLLPARRPVLPIRTKSCLFLRRCMGSAQLYAERRFRPFALLLDNTRRPAEEAMRVRKPCLRFRTNTLG
jgi:hypothetical protein